MTDVKNKERVIHNIEEFEKAYLPKKRKGTDISVGNNMSDFGVRLVRRITSRVDMKE